MEEKIDYCQRVEQTDVEKFEMYDKCPKEEVIKMLIECGKHLDLYVGKPVLTYKNKQNAGDVAKKMETPVGELGCPHCGIVVHGAIYSQFCGFCGKPYFSDISNEEELLEKAQEYSVGCAEENTNKPKIKVAFEGFVSGYKYCLEQNW